MLLFFFAEGLVGVDKHVFQMVSLVTSVTLSLDYILAQLMSKLFQNKND